MNIEWRSDVTVVIKYSSLCSIEWHSTQTSPLRDMSPTLTNVSCPYWLRASFVASSRHSTPSQRRRWYTLSCTLTTATPCSPSFRKPLQTSCNGCSTPPPVWSPEHGSTTDIDWHPPQWISLTQRAAAGQVQGLCSSTAPAAWCSVACVTQFRRIPLRILHVSRQRRRS